MDGCFLGYPPSHKTFAYLSQLTWDGNWPEPNVLRDVTNNVASPLFGHVGEKGFTSCERPMERLQITRSSTPPIMDSKSMSLEKKPGISLVFRWTYMSRLCEFRGRLARGGRVFSSSVHGDGARVQELTGVTLSPSELVNVGTWPESINEWYDGIFRAISDLLWLCFSLLKEIDAACPRRKPAKLFLGAGIWMTAKEVDLIMSSILSSS